MQDWVITIPKTISWTEYEKEIKAVEDYSMEMNFRTPVLCSARAGDRCFIVHDGRVRGWMQVTGSINHPHGFKCRTTGQFWAPGNYIKRSGPFHPIEGRAMKGFQGIRRYK